METDAITLLNKYNVSYILFSERVKRFYNINELKYATDTNCFKLVYDRETEIYESLCEKEEIKIEI